MNTKIKKGWKTLKLIDNKIVSENGNCIWSIGEWKHEDNITLCEKGFHASKLSIDAMVYITPDIFAEIEYTGDIIEDNDKFVCSDMRIIRAYEWTKRDSMNLSIFCVKQSMKYFDKNKFPEVWSACLNSIKVIEDVLLNDTEETGSAGYAAWSAGYAAWSAAESARYAAARYAAWSARYAATRYAAGYAAGSAVRYAAWSAGSAAWSAAESVAGYAARSAAWYAAESARYAGYAAGSAAESATESAAESAARNLQHKWLIKYIHKNCKKILR